MPAARLLSDSTASESSETELLSQKAENLRTIVDIEVTIYSQANFCRWLEPMGRASLAEAGGARSAARPKNNSVRRGRRYNSADRRAPIWDDGQDRSTARRIFSGRV